METSHGRPAAGSAGANGRAADAPPPDPAATVVTVRHELPPRAVVKAALALAVTLGALWLLAKLATVLLLLFVAFLLTAALDPLVGRLERRGWPRPLSVALIVLALLGLLALGGLLLVPPLVDQVGQLRDGLPGYLDRARGLARANRELIDRLRAAAGAGSGSADPKAVLTGALAVGAGVVQGVADLVVVLVMTAYLLVDGERSYNWVVHYLPPGQRAKIRRALPEVSRVVSGYLLGQAVTSLLFALFAYALLWAVGVPQPLLLAVAAALVDAIPVAGVLLATVPAALLALTVSVPAAAVVAGGYLAYHQVESHVLVPRIYAGRLRISSFAVLVAALAGWTLLGIVGVLLALPIAATVPVVEAIWREEPAAAAGDDDPARP